MYILIYIYIISYIYNYRYGIFRNNDDDYDDDDGVACLLGWSVGCLLVCLFVHYFGTIQGGGTLPLF